jgi:uncharacterized membrane protein YbhN (UPF0104 family)
LDATLSAALPFLHPALGAVALAVSVALASAGFQGRRRPGRGDLDRHRRLGPWALALMLATWALGAVSVLLWRNDLELAESLHFGVGTAIAMLFVLSAASSKWLDTGLVRRVHPWIGAAALLLAGAQTVLGLSLLP